MIKVEVSYVFYQNKHFIYIQTSAINRENSVIKVNKINKINIKLIKVN